MALKQLVGQRKFSIMVLNETVARYTDVISMNR